MRTTPGKLIVNDALPEWLRDYAMTLTSDEAEKLLGRLARQEPDNYREIAHKLTDIGRNAAFDESATIGLTDMRPNVDRAELFEHARSQTALIQNDTELNPLQKRQAIAQVYGMIQKTIADNNYASGREQENPFALQVLSKARGTKDVLAALQASPGSYTDPQGNIIPVFVSRSFAEGLRPHEYWAGSFGARTGVVSTKFATRSAGDLGKQFNQASMRTVVTKDDCETLSGIPVKANDNENIGAELAKPTGKYPVGTVLTKEIISELGGDDDEIVVRSPLTCGQPEGVCKHCVGLREDGNYPKLGDHVGITASSALAERIAQGSLNCLAEGTEVRMADLTTRRIEDLRVGDLVLGADVTGRAFPTEVTAVWDQGIQPVQRYDYSIGGSKRSVSVVCTEKHPVLVTKKVSAKIYKKHASDNYWSPTSFTPQKLPAGVRGNDVGAVLPNDITALETRHEPLAALCGLLLGDGIRWDTIKFRHNSPRFSCADVSLIDDLNDLLTQVGCKARKCKRSYDYALTANTAAGWSDADRTSGRRVRTKTRHAIKQSIIRWGLTNCYAHEKMLPGDVFTWDKLSATRLIAGYLAADGSVGISAQGHPFISFGSTSRPLLEGLQKLLELKLAVYPGSISVTARAGSGNHKHDMHALYITRTDQIRKFSEIVREHIPGVKRCRLAEVIDAVANYNTTSADPFVRAVRKSVTKLGERQCRDITVAHADSLFVLANGLIVSNTKHSGGMTSGKKEDLAGFDIINQLFQSPKQFAHAAAVATVDGEVERIVPAPQGGFNVYIGNTPHYVLPENITEVAVGDKVEAGDQLSDGLLNPRDVLEYKGVGEARRYLTERATKAFRDSGYAVHRRNMELLVRGVINHAELDDDVGPFTIGDVVDYSTLASTYKPREDSKVLDINASIGQYLEQPALHHTIGTRVTDRVAKQLHKHGYKDVTVNTAAPLFKPRSFGLRAVPQQEKDWLAQLGSSHLTKNLLKNVHRGSESNLQGLHPVPAMAKSVDLGRFTYDGIEPEEKRIL